MYGIRDELNAYFFDRAVTTFGHAIDSALEDAGKNAKTTAKAEQARSRVLNQWLGLNIQQFRDPAGSVSSDTKTSSEKGIVKL